MLQQTDYIRNYVPMNQQKLIINEHWTPQLMEPFDNCCKKNYFDFFLCLPFDTEISDNSCFFKALLTRSVKTPISGREDIFITANVINSVSLVTRMSCWGFSMRRFCLSTNSPFMSAERASLHCAISSFIRTDASSNFNSHSVNKKCLK